MSINSVYLLVKGIVIPMISSRKSRGRGGKGAERDTASMQASSNALYPDDCSTVNPDTRPEANT